MCFFSQDLCLIWSENLPNADQLMWGQFKASHKKLVALSAPPPTSFDSLVIIWIRKLIIVACSHTEEINAVKMYVNCTLISSGLKHYSNRWIMETVCAPNTTQADRRRAHEFYWNLISLLQPFMWKTWRTRERSANLLRKFCSAWAEKLELWRNLDWNGS